MKIRTHMAAMMLAVILAVSAVLPAAAGSYVPDTWFAHVTVTLNQRMATRTGPGTQYDEPGSFLSAGDRVVALSKAYDSRNGIWWVQVEFTYAGERIRAYTGAKRFSDLNLSLLPEEQKIGYAYAPGRMTGYYGPSSGFRRIRREIPADSQRDFDIIAVSCEYGAEYYQVEFYDAGMGCYRRAWVERENHLSRDYFYSEYDGTFDYSNNWPGQTNWSNSQNNTNSSTGYCIITVDSGNARRGPGTDYEHAGYVHRGDTYDVMEIRKGNTGKDWYKINLRGTVCWISSGIATLVR